jgi:hypothetical protein
MPINMTNNFSFDLPPLPDKGTDAGSNAVRECVAIAGDLERLRTLINDAGDKLMTSFGRLQAVAPRVQLSTVDEAELHGAVMTAVTALQFQDMATQLVQHAQRRLSVLQNCVSSLTEEVNDPLLASTRMQPVRQSAVNAGSVDLF